MTICPECAWHKLKVVEDNYIKEGFSKRIERCPKCKRVFAVQITELKPIHKLATTQESGS